MSNWNSYNCNLMRLTEFSRYVSSFFLNFYHSSYFLNHLDIILLVISWVRSTTRLYMQEAKREREGGGHGRNQEYGNLPICLTTYSLQSPYKPGLTILKRRIIQDRSIPTFEAIESEDEIWQSRSLSSC